MQKIKQQVIKIYTDGGIRPSTNYVSGTGYGGTGFVVLQGSEVLFEGSESHPPPATNQQMEIMAAIRGLMWAATNPYVSSERIVIFSDSAYLVNCMSDEKWWFKWMTAKKRWANTSGGPVKNADMWRKVLSMCRSTHEYIDRMVGPNWEQELIREDVDTVQRSRDAGLDVLFSKVRGHSGDPGNDRADALATMGKNVRSEE